MKTSCLLILFQIVWSLPLLAGDLAATAIFRSVGDADKNEYISGYTSAEKGNVGYMPDGQQTPKGKVANMWKTLIAFDAASMLEELSENPSGEFETVVHWVKSAPDVKDAKIYYIGTYPSIEMKNETFFPKYSVQGEEVGTITSEELAGVKKAKTFTFDFEDIIPAGDVTPSNRYIFFRIESEIPDDREANGQMGFSPVASDHILHIGDSKGSGGGAKGGY